jgi:hypothetical protein
MANTKNVPSRLRNHCGDPYLTQAPPEGSGTKKPGRARTSSAVERPRRDDGPGAGSWPARAPTGLGSGRLDRLHCPQRRLRFQSDLGSALNRRESSPRKISHYD